VGAITKKRLTILCVAAGILLFVGLSLANVAPSTEIAWVLGVLLLTIYLFSFEVVPIDVAAISIMVLLGLTSLFGPVMGLDQGLVEINNLFAGFSSNAVMSIIAVMIIGAGLDKTGAMNAAARTILRVGGSTERRIIPLISGTVGVISGFMQNVGAAALFLPVVSRIAARTDIAISRLLMPMGFCAILGGTLTLVGSSPLILLNDLIANSNAQLPADQQMDSFGLFSTLPIGIMLVLTGIGYFVLMGRFVLPKVKGTGEKKNDPSAYFRESYDLDFDVFEIYVPPGSSLVGKELDEFETQNSVRTVALLHGKQMRMGAGDLPLNLVIEAKDYLAVIGVRESLKAFADRYNLGVRPINKFSEVLSQLHSGLAETVVPPTSRLIDESSRTFKLRSGFGICLLAIVRKDGTRTVGEDVRSVPFEAGDTAIIYTDWKSLAEFDHAQNLAVVTTPYPKEEVRTHKAFHALTFFLIALGLVLFTDLRLSVALLVGAVGMILSGVMDADEAYHAVSWKTVFLLASLIPLGAAVETSGAAAWIADRVLNALGETSIWVIQLALAVLATGFTLVMSNVGATVLLVPLAINIAIGAGADPAVFALTVALATSNSFLIPTHQVNALIMGPGGYSVPDFLRAGGIMTILFLIVLIVMLQVVF